jgi:hypothetical protein
MEEEGDPRHELLRSNALAYAGREIGMHKKEDDLGLERGAVQEAWGRRLGTRHSRSFMGDDGVTYSVNAGDHDGQPTFEITTRLPTSSGAFPMIGHKHFWHDEAKDFADRMGLHDPEVGAHLHAAIDEGHGEFLNRQHQQAGDHAHAMAKKKARNPVKMARPVPVSELHPELRFTRLGAVLRHHVQTGDHADPAVALADGALSMSGPHDQPMDTTPLKIMRDYMLDNPDHELAQKFNWDKLPEKVELDRKLSDGTLTPTGFGTRRFVSSIIHDPDSDFHGKNWRIDEAVRMAGLHGLEWADRNHIKESARRLHLKNLLQDANWSGDDEVVLHDHVGSDQLSSESATHYSRESTKFARVEPADVHPDYQPTGIAPRMGHALGRIAAEGEDVHGPNHAALAEAILRTGDHSVLPIFADALEEAGHPLLHEFDWRHAPRAIEIDRALHGAIQSLPGIRHYDGSRHDVTPGWILGDWQDGARTRLSKKKALAIARKAHPDSTPSDVVHSLVRLMSHTGGRQHEEPIPDWQIAHENTIMKRIGAIPLNPHRYPDTRPQPKQRKAKKNSRRGESVKLASETGDDLFNTQVKGHQQAISEGDAQGNPSPRLDLAAYLRSRGHYMDAYHIEQDATRPDSHSADRYPSLAKYGVHPYSHVKLITGLAADGRHQEALPLIRDLAHRGHLNDATVRHYGYYSRRPTSLTYYDFPTWVSGRATYQPSPGVSVTAFHDGSHLYDNGEGQSHPFPDAESFRQSGLVNPDSIEDQSYLDDTIKNYGHQPKWTPLGDPKGRKLGVELETVTAPNSTMTKTAKGVVDKLGSDFVTLKKDSSISGGVGGFEIVTQPATLDAHKERWGKLFDDLPKGLESEQHRSTGLHVHISREGLGKGTIGRMVRLMNAPGTRAFIKMVAGRTSGYAKIQGKKTIAKPGFKDRDRYKAINLLPDKTVELRIFKGTTSKPKFMAALEFADALANYCQPAVAGNKGVENPDGLIEYVNANRKSYPHLHELCQSYKSGNRKFSRDQEGYEFPPRVPVSLKVRLSLVPKRNPGKMSRVKMAANEDAIPTNPANIAIETPANKYDLMPTTPTPKRIGDNKAGKYLAHHERVARLEMIARVLAARGDHRAPIAAARAKRAKEPSNRWANLDRHLSRQKPEALTHAFKATNGAASGSVSFFPYHSPFDGVPMVYVRHQDGLSTTAAHLTPAEASKVARTMPANGAAEEASANAVAARVAEHAYSRAKMARRGSPAKMGAQVKSGLAQALSRLHSGTEKAFRETLAEVLNRTQLTPHKIHSVLHDTPDDVKPSVAASIMKNVDDRTADYAGAWHGLLTKQPSVLLFRSHPEGEDSIYRMKLQQKPEEIRATLNKLGFHSRLLVPKNGHTEVVLHDPGRKKRSKVGMLASKLKVPVEEVAGTGRILGGRDAEAARAKYREVQRSFESGGKAKMNRRGKVLKMSKEVIETLIDSLEPEDFQELTGRRAALSDMLEEDGRTEEALRLKEHRQFGVHSFPEKHIVGGYQPHQDGYPLVHTAEDGGTFCSGCANGGKGSLAGRFDSEDDPAWHIVDSSVHWEGPPLHCDHCGEQINSAYGDPDDQEDNQ